jgi:hypothetical protein
MYVKVVHYAGLSDFSVRGAARQHFPRQVAQLFHRKFRRQNKCPISLRSDHPVCMYVWIRMSLGPEGLDSLYSYSVLKGLSFLCQRLVTTSIVASENGNLHRIAEHKIAIFSKPALTISIKFQQFVDIISLKKAT